MIVYALACDSGHRFDSWFRDGAAYEAQVARGEVQCPVCASARVAKTVMAPAISGARKRDAAPTETPAPHAAPEPALLDDRCRAVRAVLKSVRDKVVADGHDVGASFPAEARRIHEGDAPVRRIYGQASPEEARGLLEDGIMVMPLPIVPDEMN